MQLFVCATFCLCINCTCRCNSRCIIRCTLNCIIKCTLNAFIVVLFAICFVSPGPLKSSLLFHFLIGKMLHPFAPLSPFLKAFSSVFKVRSHLQSQLHLGELCVTCLCSFKQIIDCILKCTMIYTNACVIYSAVIALCACVK